MELAWDAIALHTTAGIPIRKQVLFASALLGSSQGLTWSTTVIMKIARRSAGSRWASTSSQATSPSLQARWRPASLRLHYGLRPQPFYLGVAFVAIGSLLSALVVRETRHHVAAESKLHGELPPEGTPTQRGVFWRTSLLDKNLSSVSQAGLVNNLNDGMAWGLFPLFFTAAQMNLAQVGTLAAIYPATGASLSLFTRRVVGSRGPKVAHYLGHVGPGGGYHLRGPLRGVSPALPRGQRSWAWARPWCNRRCSRPLATWRIPHGARHRWACIACGAIWATRSGASRRHHGRRPRTAGSDVAGRSHNSASGVIVAVRMTETRRPVSAASSKALTSRATGA